MAPTGPGVRQPGDPGPSGEREDAWEATREPGQEGGVGERDPGHQVGVVTGPVGGLFEVGEGMIILAEPERITGAAEVGAGVLGVVGQGARPGVARRFELTQGHQGRGPRGVDGPVGAVVDRPVEVDQAHLGIAQLGLEQATKLEQARRVGLEVQAPIDVLEGPVAVATAVADPGADQVGIGRTGHQGDRPARLDLGGRVVQGTQEHGAGPVRQRVDVAGNPAELLGRRAQVRPQRRAAGRHQRRRPRGGRVRRGHAPDGAPAGSGARVARGPASTPGGARPRRLPQPPRAGPVPAAPGHGARAARDGREGRSGADRSGQTRPGPPRRARAPAGRGPASGLGRSGPRLPGRRAPPARDRSPRCRSRASRG